MQNARLTRAQSAMEYLMTYGWAILIIAVVLGALYQIGIFNPGSLSGKAQPGSCQVLRPNGANTTQLMSLSGVCNGQLPQFVASFSGKGSYVNFGNSPLMSPEAGAKGAMSLCMWYTVTSLTGYVGPALKGQGVPSYGNGWEYTFDQQGTAQGFTVWNTLGSTVIASYSTGNQPTPNKWNYACMTYNYAGGNAYYYLNGAQKAGVFSAGNGPATAGTGNFVVGGGENGYSSVLISNVQLYNASLSSNEISALYIEGIGGAPIQLRNIVGWWPLNGNQNDYSGDLQNGVANSISYTSSWTNGYSTP
ncbi:MAG: LamG domain-containing protein [Candidatus Micrarchaeota archaeon]|nr:LamG domain-containing protein [Candidatus Micrarchaeota archaeon]